MQTFAMTHDEIRSSLANDQQTKFDRIIEKIQYVDKNKGSDFVQGLVPGLRNLANRHDSTNGKKIIAAVVSAIENKAIYSKSNSQLFPLIRVIDGDSFVIDYYGEETTVRLLGIDAPETRNTSGSFTCLAQESKDFVVKALSGNASINLEFDESQGKRDSFGRLLGYVKVGNNLLNNMIIKEGLAFEYTYQESKPYTYQSEFRKLEIESKTQKKGVFSDLCTSQSIIQNSPLSSTGSTNTGTTINVNVKYNSGIFYTSSHHTSEKYYCENDPARKNLSETYLRKFTSEEELKKVYPSKNLNQPCQ